MKPHKHAEAIKAWADGAEIEVFVQGKWERREEPMWTKEVEYRIKPEPKPDVVMYFTEGFLQSYGQKTQMCANDVKVTWDGETGKLKKAEVL